MRIFLVQVLAVAVFLSVGPGAGADTGDGESRTWTSSDGKTVEGTLLAYDGDEVTLLTERGEFKLPLSRLGAEDQEFVKAWKEGSAGGEGEAMDPDLAAKERSNKGSELLTDPLDEVELGVWPKFVVAEFDVDEIEVVKEDEVAGEYIYRSPHFEFLSPEKLSTSVVREFARIFEATYEFARAIPIGLNPEPWKDGYYQTKLYGSNRAYQEDGGMAGSGGMFSYSWRGREIVKGIIKVPLSNLGVENTGRRWIVDHGKRSDTLTHEIAHQMTGRWLPIMPVWFKEGLAETISTQRYDNGRFTLTSMDRGIREDVTKRSGDDREFSMLGLEKLMNITSQQWSADLASGQGGRVNYPSANVLFYFFVRLDGDGKGTNLVNYMRAVAEGMDEVQARQEILMADRSYEQLEEDLAKAWRSEGLQVTYQ
ncbi:MAG: hypothetical protein AAF591_04325 [Verrucomicrobiota bacterium]